MNTFSHETRRIRRLPAIFFILSLLIRPVAASDAAATLAGLQARYARAKSLTADFTQVFHTRTGKTVRETGRLHLKKPGRMRWEYQAPEAKIFLSDGKQTWFYVPAEKRATVEPVREARDPRLPFMFLLGRSDAGKDFSRIETGSEAPVRAGNVVLRLWPRARIDNLSEIRVECVPATFELVRISIIHTSGERSDFLLSNMVENSALADSLFVFSPPPGVRVERTGN